MKRAECARKACKRYYRRYRDKELDRASAFLQPAETCGGPYVEAKDAVADKLEGPLRKAGVIMAKVS